MDRDRDYPPITMKVNEPSKAEQAISEAFAVLQKEIAVRERKIENLQGQVNDSRAEIVRLMEIASNSVAPFVQPRAAAGRDYEKPY